MRLGVDTNVLVYAHVPSLEHHAAVRDDLLGRLGDGRVTVVLTPAVLHELVHVVTDPHRFDPPVSIPEAIAVARLYLDAANVECIAVDADATQLAFELMERHRLGRKRLADTLFAATLLNAGVRDILTCNPSDFEVFEGLSLIDPSQPAAG
jgi:predicted nucleic acid-binding protein